MNMQRNMKNYPTSIDNTELPRSAFEDDEIFDDENQQGRSGSGSGSGKNKRKGKSKTPALDNFSRDLSEMARLGKLDPVVGRDDVIDKIIQILNKRKKNNALIVGEPGIGKCICKDTKVTLRNDISGDIIEISVEDFLNTIPNA